MSRKPEFGEIRCFWKDRYLNSKININSINNMKMFPVRTLLKLGNSFFDRGPNKNLNFKLVGLYNFC
jgi:hypothetical protein